MKNSNPIEKIIHIGNNYYLCNDELPQKGDQIIVEQLDGSYILQEASRDLSHRDCMVENTRMIWPVIADCNFML